MEIEKKHFHLEIAHSLRGSDGNDISDPMNIKSEYRKKFQHRLRKRNIKPELKSYENFQNSICQLRLSVSQKNISPDFTLSELKFVVKEFKNGKCMDPIGHVRDIFKHSGDSLLISLLCMMNKIKSSRILPLEWSNIWMKTQKKKKGSPNILNNCKGIFVVPILSIILEKLIKKRNMNTLRNNISQFQNGGMKGKRVVDNLIIIRGVIDHALYLGKELCITFFDIEKCFDSLWLEDCINSSWENGIRDDDMLSLIYLTNTKVYITIRTLIGESQPFTCSNIVKELF